MFHLAAGEEGVAWFGNPAGEGQFRAQLVNMCIRD